MGYILRLSKIGGEGEREGGGRRGGRRRKEIVREEDRGREGGEMEEEERKRRHLSWDAESALYCAAHIMMQQKHSLVCKQVLGLWPWIPSLQDHELNTFLFLIKCHFRNFTMVTGSRVRHSSRLNFARNAA